MSAPLTPERIRQLLGGYATGTLTPEERAALMQAALTDQALFDQLLEEDALREALEDRTLRAELIEALQPRRPWWRAPWPWAALATATAAVSLFVLLRPQPREQVAAVPEAREIAANLAKKPEPVLSEIPVPRTLRLDTPAAPQPAKTAARRDAAVPPAEQAAPAPAPAVSGEMRAIVTEAVSTPQFAAAAPKRKEEKADQEQKKGGEAGAIEFASQQPDGSWRVAAPGAPLPAGRPLRLRFTPDASGTLSMDPRLAPPLVVEAGVPAEWLLPPQPRGDLLLRISQAVPARMERAKARAVADSAAGAAANRAAPPPREIRLRIE